ncbi:unnamed protein product [Rhizophagus irregularis]|nr:unnamed protein product [Rhizophagus irregularis]
MNFLKAEIENKRKFLENIHSEEQEQKKKKYVRRSDVEKKREQQYLAEQAEIEKKREERKRQKNKTLLLLAEQEKAEKSASDSEGQKEEYDGSDTFNISPEEVVRRLRAKGQPIRLFGESDKDRKTRLRALELIEERTEIFKNQWLK